MKRWTAATLVLVMLLGSTPPMAVGQQYGTEANLGSADAEARVHIAKDHDVILTCKAGTLSGTIVPEISGDGGDTWGNNGSTATVSFMSRNGDITASEAPDGSWSAFSRGLVFGTGATHARVRVSSWTSGTTACKLTAVPQSRYTVIVGPDGSILRAPAVVNSAPGSSAYGLVVRIAGSAGTGTSLADGDTVTPGTTTGTPMIGVYQATPSTCVDTDGCIARIAAKRGWIIGGIETPNGDSMIDETVDSLKVSQTTVGTSGGQSAASTTTAYKNCPSQVSQRFDSAGTVLLSGLTGVSGETYRFCGMMVQFDTEATTNTFQLVRGDNGGTNCGTNVASVTLPNTKSFIWGDNSNEVWDGGAANKQICGKLAGTSGAVLHLRYGSM
jgi:hypothetical protein